MLRCLNNKRVLYSALAVVALLGAVLRFWPNPMPYMELDASIYVRAAGEYAHAIQDGTIFTNALSADNYSAVEYWPPLYPMLGGLFRSPLGVAAVAGWLAIFPVFALGRALFREEGDEADLANFVGLVAAAFVAIHPYLVWWSRVPRSESLYILWAALAMWCVLPGHHRGKGWLLGGGACVGLAFTTRFDGVGLALALVLALAWQRRRVAPIVWFVLGALISALPYLLFLAHLNGGTPTLITPQKSLYDTLEGVWTRAYERSTYEFTVEYGVPGLFRFNLNENQMDIVRDSQTLKLVGEGIVAIPRTLVEVSCNWMLLAAPLLLSLKFWRERRLQTLLLAASPCLGMAIFMSWDPNPRYYAFSLIPLSVVGARGLYYLATGATPAKIWRWLICGVVVPLSLAWAWVIPSEVHFDQHGPTDAMFLELMPQASHLHSAMVVFGFAEASILLYFVSPWLAALIAFVGAAGVSWGSALPALQMQAGWFRSAVPGGVLLLSLLAFPMYLSMPRKMWGERAVLWFMGLFATASIYGAGMLQIWGEAQARLEYCPQMNAYLSEQAERWQLSKIIPFAHPGFGARGPRVLASQQVDALSSGARWVPFSGNADWSTLITKEQPRYVLLTLPEPDAGDSGISINVPELCATGAVRLVKRERAYGSDDTCSRWWCLYEYTAQGKPCAKPTTEQRRIMNARRAKLSRDLPEVGIGDI